jgi:hypothetical protein
MWQARWTAESDDDHDVGSPKVLLQIQSDHDLETMHSCLNMYVSRSWMLWTCDRDHRLLHRRATLREVHLRAAIRRRCNPTSKLPEVVVPKCVIVCVCLCMCVCSLCQVECNNDLVNLEWEVAEGAKRCGGAHHRQRQRGEYSVAFDMCALFRSWQDLAGPQSKVQKTTSPPMRIYIYIHILITIQITVQVCICKHMNMHTLVLYVYVYICI